MPEPTRDPQKLRALAHPLRWRLLDVLLDEGSATATRCSQLLGESVASCSYHLNFLAKYGYVEEAPGVYGRRKPWRLTDAEQNLSGAAAGPDGEVAEREAVEAFLDHEFDRIKERLRHAGTEPDEWREATAVSGVTVPLTVAEAREVSQALEAVLRRYTARTTGDEPTPAATRLTRIFIATSVAPSSETETGG